MFDEFHQIHAQEQMVDRMAAGMAMNECRGGAVPTLTGWTGWAPCGQLRAPCEPAGGASTAASTATSSCGSEPGSTGAVAVG